jgi:hypothetical protein
VIFKYRRVVIVSDDDDDNLNLNLFLIQLILTKMLQKRRMRIKTYRDLENRQPLEHEPV